MSKPKMPGATNGAQEKDFPTSQAETQHLPMVYHPGRSRDAAKEHAAKLEGRKDVHRIELS